MKISKINDIGNRESVLLENENFRLCINKEKAMVSELSARKGDAWINAHWQPWFRNNGGEPWNEDKHAPFWKVPLLFDIAGNFPCCPNFGPGHARPGKADMPPHGFTSNMTWTLEGMREDGETVAADWSLAPAGEAISYEKKDFVVKGQPVHYSRLKLSNVSGEDQPYNVGWHNTVGAPFLESGCLIDDNATVYSVPAEGTEFDDTGRFSFGEEFDSMEKTPLRSGGTAAARIVPGNIGYADFIAGAVPSDCDLGWSSIVNPRQKMVYLSWFDGPAAVEEDEIPLYFYNYWMNYGGRPYQPWAATDGGTDRSFCLGAENTVSCYANGLEESLERKTLLGHPTHLILKAGDSKTLNYATAFFPYDGDIFDRGITRVEKEDGKLTLFAGSRSKSMNIGDPEK